MHRKASVREPVGAVERNRWGPARSGLLGDDVAVEHLAVNSIPADTQVVVTHASLAKRAQGMAPGAVVVPFQIFMGDPAFERVESAIRDGGVLDG